jgi:hypothetical protein
MMIVPLEFFWPQDAHQEVPDQQQPDDESDDVGHGQSLSQARA